MLTIDPETPIILIDGVEYIQNPLIGWEYKTVRLFTLDDGSRVTARMVSDFLESTNSCARARLMKYTDPKKIYRISNDRKPVEDRFKVPKEMIDSHQWYTDPLTKLMLK
jgi:hypothetical protein